MLETILEIKNIAVEIATSHIISELSLSVKKGESLGIIGPNGSGKTTFFNAISGFVPISTGEINLLGEQISSLNPSERALRGMVRVFQNSGVFKDMTLEENLLVALESKSSIWNMGFPWSRSNKNLSKLAYEMLADVDLGSKFKEKASSLSGGQLRLLEITRAMAFGAELFLLDEPTAGVSPKMKDEVVDLVKRLSSHGKTVLIIEHDINLIQRFCERIIVLDAGKIVLDGTPSEIRNNQALQEIYFGSEL